MQLIMDTEPTADIQDKMSSFEESLESKLSTIDSDRNAITNGNKENIKILKNVIENTALEMNGDNVKILDDFSDIGRSEMINAEDGLKQSEDITTVEEENIEVNSNGIHGSESDLINQNDEDDITLVEDENVNQLNDVTDNALVETTTGDGDERVSGDEEDQSSVTLDDIQIVEEDVPNTSLSTTEDSSMIKSSVISDTKANITDEANMDVDQLAVKICNIDKEPVLSDIIVLEDNSINAKLSEVSEKDDQNNGKLEETAKEDLMEIEVSNNTDDIVNGKSEVENNLIDLEINVAESEKAGVNLVEEISKSLDTNQSKTETHENDTSTLKVEFFENVDDANISSNKLIKDNQSTEVNITEKPSSLKETGAESEKSPEENKDSEDILDIDKFLEGTDVLAEEIKEQSVEQSQQTVEKLDEPVQTVQTVEPKKAPLCKLSNTLDILSDDDDEDPPIMEAKNNIEKSTPTVEHEKQCINIEDDDDIMLIDEVTDTKNSTSNPVETKETLVKQDEIDKKSENITVIAEPVSDVINDSTVPETATEIVNEIVTPAEIQEEKSEAPRKPLLAENFLKGHKKNLAEMTREELEEFCIIKIVEGIVDRSNLSDIKSKLKAMAQNIEEYKKKAMMLTKQNRDLQLVLKSVQEEQKKNTDTPIIPLKITRSVGMQVLMTEKPNMRRRSATGNNNIVNNKVSNNRTPNQGPRPQKTATNNQQQIPVPRLVPAATNPAVKSPNAIPQTNVSTNVPKAPSQSPLNGMKAPSPVQKNAEKRPFNRVQEVTVDLTDDEPPSKVTPRSSPVPPVRLLSPQNLLARPQFAQALNSPRKVYIPISGPQSQNIRPGQTIMLKSVPPPPGQRMRGPVPHTARMPQNQVRLTRVPRHPAPLPECTKQYQPSNWKALPPAPDLKLSKVENGIVISWKIEGYQEDSYEEIASYQLYAYQETSSPPSTSLWKKIGDVKALPLPMACTLTQFMAGFKYYFAVRAVDIRSRLGLFSLPGSILLLNKM